MKASSLYHKYISSKNVGEEPQLLTIAAVHKIKMVSQGVRLGLGFQERPEILPLNHTNAQALIKKYGDETDKWIGMKVTLTVVDVPFGDDMVEGVRLS